MSQEGSRRPRHRTISGLPMGGRPLCWGSLLALLLLCVLGVESLSSGAVTLPSAKTPSVTVSSVTVPSVSTPVATTPQVSTPSVSAPSVSAPSTVSHAVGGAVSTVKSTAPAVGGTVSHLTSAPSSVTSAPRSATSAVTGTAGVTSSAVSSSTSSTAGSSTSGSASSLSSSRASAASAHSDPSHRSSAAARRELARRQAKQDAALRHLVAQDAGCLSELAPVQARTLALRAGLGGQRPDSAVQVARILGVSSAREQTIERGALDALRTDGNNGCGPAPSPMTVAAVEFVTAHDGTLVAPLSPAPTSLVAGSGTVAAPGSTANGGSGSGAGAGSSSGAGAGSSSSAHEGGSLPQGPAIRSASISSGSNGGVGWNVAILVLIALVALAVPFLINAMRQRRATTFAGGAAAATTGPADSSPAATGSAVAAPAAADAASLWIPAALRAPEGPAAAEAPAAPAPVEPAAPATDEPEPAAPAPEEPAAPAAETPPPATTAATTSPQPAPPVEKRRPREPTWLRDHRSQAAIVAAGIGGVVRLLTRGRRR